MSTIYHDGKNINIPFPKEKFKMYAKKLGLKGEAGLTDEDRKRIFIWMVEDFLTGELSLDEMSEISGYMWSTMKNRTINLADILYECGELNFCVRKIDSLKEETDDFVHIMTEIMQYYRKHKNENKQTLSSQ